MFDGSSDGNCVKLIMIFVKQQSFVTICLSGMGNY